MKIIIFLFSSITFIFSSINISIAQITRDKSEKNEIAQVCPVDVIKDENNEYSNYDYNNRIKFIQKIRNKLNVMAKRDISGRYFFQRKVIQKRFNKVHKINPEDWENFKNEMIESVKQLEKKIYGNKNIAKKKKGLK